MIYTVCREHLSIALLERLRRLGGGLRVAVEPPDQWNDFIDAHAEEPVAIWTIRLLDYDGDELSRGVATEVAAVLEEAAR